MFVVYSIFETFINTYENRCFLLLILTVGGIIAKEKGFLDQGIEQVKAVVVKNKMA